MSATRNTADPRIWLDRPVPAPMAGRRLVCFPHAGGSAGFFREWGDHLPDFEVCAVRYPGRAERADEPCAEDLGRLGADIAAALAADSDGRPLVLFGHSMGAVVALETARALEARGIDVEHLFASGSRDGALPPPDGADGADDAGEVDGAGDGDDEVVLARLVALGGTDAESAADPLFADLVLPVIRADGRMFHAHGHRSDPVLRCPVTAIIGDRDPDADVRPWSSLTGRFREHVVAGDHFYLLALRPFAVLRASLDAAAPVGGRRP